MTIKVWCILLLLLGLNQVAFSQTEKMSDSAKALAEKVKEGDNQSILKAGNSGDKTLIPYLKALASKGSPWAQMALAKLGEREYLDQILVEVDADSPDIQSRGIRKLAYVGGKEALKKFYQLLDDTAPRENPNCKKEMERFKENHSEIEKCGFCCDVLVLTRSSMAILYLSQMVDNPPTKRGMWGIEEDVPLWKEWFERNKYLIEDY